MCPEAKKLNLDIPSQVFLEDASYRNLDSVAITISVKNQNERFLFYVESRHMTVKEEYGGRRDTQRRSAR